MAKRAAHHDVAGGERGVDVAVGQPRRAQDVVGQLLVLQSARCHGGVSVGDVRPLVGGGLDHPRPWRAGPGRGLQVHHRLERVQLHVDEACSVLRLRLGLGDHQRHRLPGVDDLFAREWLVQPSLPARNDRQVGSGEHGDDPGERLGLLGVDGGDHRVGLVGQDQASVEQPGYGRVARELGRAPYLGL